MGMNPRTLRPGSAFTPKSISGLALWLDGSDASTLYTTDAGPVTAVSSPLDISGCVGWWDASDASTLFNAQSGGSTVTTNGGTVARWEDKSGGGRHLSQSTANTGLPTLSTSTLNGRNVVAFGGTGTGAGFDMASPVSRANETVIAVFLSEATGGDSTHAIINDGGDGYGLVVSRGSATFLEASSGNFTVGSGRIRATINGSTNVAVGPTVATFGRGSSLGLFQAGDSMGAAPTNAARTFSRVGYYGTSNLIFRLKGYIAELVVFDSELSAANRARVEAYLAAKWGISGVHAKVGGSGALVAYWGDKSGRGRHATQVTLGSRPTFTTGDLNGRSTLRTAGAQAMSVPAWDYTAANTAIFVFRGSALNQGIYQRGAVNNGPRAAIQGSPVVTLRGTIHGSAASQADSVASYAVGTWGIGATVVNSGSITAYASGVRGTSQNYSVQLSGSYLMHLFNLGSGLYPLNGGIAEFAYYDRELSAAELGRVTRYLGAKWGISLPPQVSNADAQSWINRVYGNGGTVSNSTAAAVNAFCNAIDAAGIRDRFYRLNLFCGTGLPACLVPLYQNWKVYAGRNRQLYGDNMTTSGWSKSGVTATLSTTERPFATGPYANIVTANAATGVTPHIVSTANNFGYGTITVSAYIKAAGRNSARILLSGSSGMTFPGGSSVAWGAINLTTGAITSTSTGLTAAATDAGNGWWRLAITVTNSFGGNMAIRIDVGDGSTYNPTGSEAILVWGVQCETASSASEYDPYPLGGETDTNVNFVSGDYAETGASGGLNSGSNVSKYLRTGIAPSDIAATPWNNHVAIYSRELMASNSQCIGANSYSFFPAYSSGTRLFYRTTGNNSGAENVAITSSGHLVATRSAALASSVYRNGASVSVTPVDNGVTAADIYKLIVFGQGTTSETAAAYFPGRLQGYSLGAAISDSQAAAYYTAMQAFQTALSRNL